MNQKKCVFCDGDLFGKRSREHIFPQWLLDHLGIKDEEITPTHFSRTTGEFVSIRKHTLDDLLVGRVCEPCNTGWMSRLENEVKPSLISLISASKVITDLSANERLTIARWSAKVVYLLNFASNYHKNVPKNHYSYLYSHVDSLPENVAVLAQQHHGKSKFYWLQQAEWNVSIDNNVLKEVTELLATQSYKVTLQFGKLMLIIAYLPSSSLRFVLWSGIHVPLWPNRGQIGWYEKEEFPWDDSIKAIAAFHSGLQVAHVDYLQSKHST